MFRRLFAIETAALQIQDGDHSARGEQAPHPHGDSMLELARYSASPSCYGMWSSRAAH